MSAMRSQRAEFVGTAQDQPTARSLVRQPGDVALVVRGRLRGVVMKCPDDCGDVLTLNADPKAGKAWRVYQRNGNVTLFPSVWRTEGCKSHFIVSRGSIYWAGAEVFDDTPDPHLLRAVESLLKRVGRAGFWELADELGEMPWDVLFALRTLVGAGRAIEVPRDSGQFELVP